MRTTPRQQRQAVPRQQRRPQRRMARGAARAKVAVVRDERLQRHCGRHHRPLRVEPAARANAVLGGHEAQFAAACTAKGYGFACGSAIIGTLSVIIGTLSAIIGTLSAIIGTLVGTDLRAAGDRMKPRVRLVAVGSKEADAPLMVDDAAHNARRPDAHSIQHTTCGTTIHPAHYARRPPARPPTCATRDPTRPDPTRRRPSQMCD